jgi:4-amino-4-deoxy-L-arabinose transferase-like glycosyltransferase
MGIPMKPPLDADPGGPAPIPWWKAREVPVAVGIGILTLVKVAVAGQIELGMNEAYHWLYGRHPAWGYYNHPAMIGWLLWLSCSIFGDGPLGVRALTLLASSLGVWLVYLSARRLYDERTGRWAAVLVAVVPELFQWGSLAYPDAPLVLFWIATLWALGHIFSGDSPVWWYAAGLFLGLSLLSKYHAIFIGIGTLIFVAFSPEYRSWLRRPQPYLAALLALAVFSPTLFWNAQHHWQSLRYQSIARFDGGGVVSDRWVHVFPVTEFIHLTPFVALWAWGGGLRVLGRWRSSSWQDRLVASLGMPLLLFFAAIAPFTRVRGHWTMPAYPCLLLLGAVFVVRGGRWGRWLHAATVGLLALAYLALPVVLATVPRAWLTDWSQLAQEVRKRSPDFVISTNYHIASEMGHQLRPLVATDSVALGRQSQSFTDWWRAGDFAGRDAVIILPPRDLADSTPLIAACFDRVEDPEEVRVTRFRGREESFLLIRAHGYRPGRPRGE